MVNETQKINFKKISLECMFITEVPVSSLEIHCISHKKTHYEIVTKIGLLSFSTNVLPFKIS